MEMNMYKTTIRKVGGSMMLAIPPAIMNLLGLTAGSGVDLTVDKGRLFIQPTSKPQYQLDDLLSQCNPDAPISEEDEQWLNSPKVGRELI
jgi:antitoxin ChpS